MSSFFKRLFSRNKEPDVEVEYVEKTDQEMLEEEIPQTIGKTELLSMIEAELSPQYLIEYEGDSHLELVEFKKVSNYEDLTKRLAVFNRFFDIVKTGLSQEVSQHSDQLVSGMSNVQEIQDEISNATQASQESREHLEKVRSAIAFKSFQLYRLCKRRANQELLISKTKNFAKLCFSASLAIKTAIKSGEYYKALWLCNEASSNLSSEVIQSYNSLIQARENVTKKKGKIYMNANNRLTELTLQFDPDAYENVLLVHTTIQTAAEVNRQIQGEFIKSIARIFKNHLEPEIASKNVPLDALRQCFAEVANILYNHHLFSRWHEENDDSNIEYFQRTTYPISTQLLDSESLIAAKAFYYDVKLDLLRNRKYLWEKIQTTLVQNLDDLYGLREISPGNLNKLLGWINTFIEIGETWAGSGSIELKEKVAKICKEFFTNYHCATWNNLAEVISDEQWSRLPLPRDFTLESMINKATKKAGPFLSSLKDSDVDPSFSFSSLAYENPFANENSSPSQKSKGRDFPGIRDSNDLGPILCNSGLRYLKSVLSYITLLRALTPISFDIFHAITELTDFFIYTLLTRFCTENGYNKLFVDHVTGDLEEEYDTYLYISKYSKLKTTITRIKDFLDSLNIGSSKKFTTTISNTMKFESSNLYNLAEATIATSSISTIIESLVVCREFICEVIPENQQNYIDRFFSNTKLWVQEMSQFFVASLLPYIVKIEWLSQTIQSIKWDRCNDEPGLYVDRLFHIVEDLKERLGSLAGGSLPDHLQERITYTAIQYVYDGFLDNLSKVKRYNVQGRKQASLDFGALRKNLVELMDELPKSDAHIQYLEMWHMAAEQIVKWSLEHTEIGLRLHKILLNSSPAAQSLAKNVKGSLSFTLDNHFSNIMNETEQFN